MGERSYAAGTPSWVDLSSPDLAASADFYGGLFGWRAVSRGPVEETGGYQMFELDGKDVAGLGPQFEGGQPTAWATYVSVDDADATAKVVEAAGGTVMVAPMDVLTAGRMAVCGDHEGAPFWIWQAGDHKGADVVNEPGSLCWNELACRDPEKARTFYRSVFGWAATVNPMPGAPTSSYTEFSLAEGRPPVAGMVQMNEQWPEDIPAHWMTYFAVADCDATAARASELGGTVSIEPFDGPIGRIAVLNDQHGAVFSVVSLAARPAG